MVQHTPLISTIVLALVLAFVLGALAHRFKISPIAGYLLAGVILGPFTPGYVADQNLANQLAEIGVILLMFGVGLHFSLDDLLSVRAIAIPGAIIQIVIVTLLGVVLAWMLGWTAGAGIVFGIALSVASTVVVLRALQERRLLETERGRIAVGWLVVEDMVMVLVLVLLPPLAGVLKGESGLAFSALALPVGITLAKIATFVALMLIVGKRVIPWILHYVAHTGSRELFRLCVLAIALGVAYGASTLFDVSFALGAFLAGMIMSESALSQQAASESLPLRDAFAVLFFASVGMLFNPMILMEQPLSIVATLMIVVVAKAVTGFALVRLFGQPRSTAWMIAASRAQIGEFSFILAGLGVGLTLLPETGRDLILAGAILSILLNPLLFAWVDRTRLRRSAAAEEAAAAALAETPAREPLVPTALTDHVVLVGHGRVGSFISAALMANKTPLLVVEADGDIALKVRSQGIETIAGNAADPEIIGAANLPAARCLLVAVADAFEGGQVVEQGRAINPGLPIIARAHSQAEYE
ncbi:MAG: Kef family K(+) transporter, partial [Pseudomonadota bacterium]|nr:Kef family K(+) transporter [Pseudomonadota bacterium]